MSKQGRTNESVAALSMMVVGVVTIVATIVVSALVGFDWIGGFIFAMGGVVLLICGITAWRLNRT